MKMKPQVILSVAAAAAAGIAIGMLIAPEKGEELQKKLAESAKAWLGELSSLLLTTVNNSEEVKTSETAQLEESNVTKKFKQNV